MSINVGEKLADLQNQATVRSSIYAETLSTEADLFKKNLTEAMNLLRKIEAAGN